MDYWYYQALKRWCGGKLQNFPILKLLDFMQICWITVILANFANISLAQDIDGSSLVIGKNLSYKVNGTQKLPQCLSNVCLNGGTCYVVRGTFECTCEPGYTGTLCESALSSDSICNPKCPQMAKCIKTQCVCPLGTELFQGACRAVLTNPCSAIRCMNNGTCVEEQGATGGQKVTCKCPEGFDGVRCELVTPNATLQHNPCRAIDCGPNQKCVSRGPIFLCVPVVNESATVQPPVINILPIDNQSNQSFIIGHPENRSVISQPINSDVHSMCDERPCFNRGTCIPAPVAPGYQCICPTGWAGRQCEMDVQECRTRPCLNGGTCQELAGDFRCLCKRGYSGKFCEINNNDCAFNPCRHGGTCIDGINDFSCLCPTNWTGKTCETLYNACESGPCQNEGGCSTLPPSKEFTCTCPIGFNGTLCETNINDCAEVTCSEPGHVCVDLVGRYECRCPDGFTGQGCLQNVNECNNRTGLCQNGATCLDAKGTYRCLCRAGYTGRHCEKSVDICSIKNPCIYGICQNVPGGYECFCRPGYLGTNCTENFNECHSSPCQNNGICVDSANSYQCLCPFPFTGLHCETTIMACDSNPCKNNGTCQNNMLGYDCLCLPGTTGRHCEALVPNPCDGNPCQPPYHCMQTSFGAGYQCIPGPSRSTENSACDSVTCQNNGTCTANDDGSYMCSCHSAFRGLRCEEDIPDCLPNPCFNGGTCLERSNQTVYDLGLVPGPFKYSNASGYICMCPAGLGGQNCGEAVSSCTPNPCSNGGQCALSPAGYQCICSPGYTGRICDTDINECELGPIAGTMGPCVNANTCINTPGSYRCECKLGWGGSKCDTQLLGCFKQPCSGNATCHPYLTPEGQHAFECVCPGGRAGRNCELDTVAGFNGNSLIAFVTNPPAQNYSISLQFRTTLPNVLMLSGNDVLGTTVYTLQLISGNLKLEWGKDSLLLQNLHRSLIDGDWKKVKIAKSGSVVVLAILDSFTGIELMQESLTITQLGLNVFNTKFGKTTNQRALNMETINFIGCMRDMRVNGQQLVPANLAHSSRDIELGCTRIEQCSGNPCNDHGQCVDKWSTYECLCERPFIRPDCKFAFPEATFGYEGNRSYAQVQMNKQEQESLEMKTDISFLIRTTSPNGNLIFLGSESNANPELDTFISMELYQGQLRTNTKLGGRDILAFMGGPQVDDGMVHTISFQRKDNTVEGSVDGERVFQGKLKHPFPHPLLASNFYIGGYPLPFPEPSIFEKREKRQAENLGIQRAVTLNPRAFNTAKSFKGTIQDVRVNGMHVVLFSAVEGTGGVNVEKFGKVQLYNNVLNGTVSDDACRGSPCSNGGTCAVTFNDYQCACADGWRGKNCTKKDHCFLPNVCPESSNCVNTETGFLCLAAGTFNKGSSAQFLLEETFAQNRTMFYTISFKIRTRDQSGIILYAASANENFLLLELRNGGLDLIYRLGTTDIVRDVNLTENLNISDGKWHQVKLTLLTEQSYVNLNGNETALYLTGRPAAPLSELFASKNPLFIGSVPQDVAGLAQNRFSSGVASFKGCLDAVKFGDLPQLTFYNKSLYGQPNTTHFKPFNLNGVAAECNGEAQCGPDGVIGPCQNGARCRDLWNARQCDCQPGFRGQLCEINIDDCVNNQCDEQFGRCVDGIQNYTCACEAGYGGRFCEFEINECDSDPCSNGGTCTDLVNKFQCTCNANYTGDLCEVLITVDCDSNPCQNGATCSDWNLSPTMKSFNCSCVPGYHGRTCEFEIDYCEHGPCANGATCQSFTNIQDYRCNCVDGYTGKNCDSEINECDSNPCQNNGQCQDALASFTCACQPGWQGVTCSFDIDECATQNLCAAGSTCINTPGNYSCICPQYYLGRHCELAGSCLSSPCVHGNCSQISANNHSCACHYGYTGVHCDEEIDFCVSSPCQQGGTCHPYLGGYNCSCREGFTGTYCEEDIDECASNPCENKGTCVDLPNGFSCRCEGTGYYGTTCSLDINECNNQSNCEHGNCTNEPGKYSCHCNPGYLPPTCSYWDSCLMSAENMTDSDPKKKGHNCKNRARCHSAEVAEVNSQSEVTYQCECTQGFHGQFCDLPVQQVGKHLPLAYVIGPILGVFILLCIVGCIGFVMVARKKRATRGHYSPSRQEMTGARVQMGPMMKPPPEERLI